MTEPPERDMSEFIEPLREDIDALDTSPMLTSSAVAPGRLTAAAPDDPPKYNLA